MKARRWAPVVFGVAVFAVFVAICAVVVGVVWFRDHLSIEEASDTGAEAAFEAVRQQYTARAPLLEMHGTSPPRSNPPPPDAPRIALSTLHVLAWDAGDARLARFEIPFWFLRLKEGPIRFGNYASGLDELKITLTVAEMERYGPGILMDISRTGRDRALLWAD